MRCNQVEFDFEYLKHLIQETIEIGASFKYFNVNENDCEISYISNNNKTSICLQQGLMCQFDCKRYKLKEKSNIRKDSKYYCKIYRKSDKIIRVDSYVKGRIDVVFLAYYSDNKRFMFPFSATGGFYPTYTYVTHFLNNDIDEEYAVNKRQIVYKHYQMLDENHCQYDCINYVPNGTHPILGTESGIFTLNPELMYTLIETSNWRMSNEQKVVRTE